MESVALGPKASTLPVSEATETEFRLGHRRWLDGLRGIAIVLVLLYHFHLLDGGFLGVDLFFVLSGFLITTLLLEEWRSRGRIDLLRFYLRRALRLMPALLAVVLACLLFMSCFRSAAELTAFRKEAIVSICYVANWPSWHQTRMPTLGHTWSLSVEEQFYLLWPAMLLLLLRCRLSLRTITWIVVGGILLCALWRFGLHRLDRVAGRKDVASVIRLYEGLDTRADALLAGCLVGCLAVQGCLRRVSSCFRVWQLAAIIGLALVVAPRLTHAHFGLPQLYYGLFTVIALTYSVLLMTLLAVGSSPVHQLLEWSPLVALGRISYGVYLVHIPIIRFAGLDDLGWDHPGNALLAAGSSLLAAVLLHYSVERPFLRWKDRLRPIASSEVGQKPAPFRAAA